MNQSQNTTFNNIASKIEIQYYSTNDYRKLLKKYGLNYTTKEYYLQVGEITWTQGWILDITIIRTQVLELLKIIIPFFITENVPFKIAKNEDIARSIASGDLGYIILGKIIVVYPRDEEQAKNIANKLIICTNSFKGPRILTDRYLGSIIYVRYGACAPIISINERGAQDEYIYDANHTLVKDKYTIPFTLPSGINWPFNTIVAAKAPAIETVLQDKYKPISILKEDAKGDVKKALWLEKFYKIKWCVVKEGKQYMNTDSHGRDIGDRLRWQLELHKDLQDIIPIPRIYDFFEENGDTYLVMEYIKGKDLDDVVQTTFGNKTWAQLLLVKRLLILKYAEQILNIIEQIHNKGYIHRDITPANFLVTRQQQLWVIDLELSYSERLQKPFPPFRLGTTGFMSPEQEVTQSPTVEQDIYAIGAILISLFTALLPTKFTTHDKEILKKQLHFFISDDELVDIISNCLNDIPELRPTIIDIKKVLKQFRLKQTEENLTLKTELTNPALDKEIVKDYINKAIKGLALPIMMNSEYLWLSKTIQEEGFTYYQMESGTVYTGFYEGLSGVLYLLARAQKMNFPISPCMNGYLQSWAFIIEKKEHWSTETPAGLYGGTAGVAMALIEGMESGLIANEVSNKKEIQYCLQQKKTEGNGIAKGIAGKGIALLKAINVLDNSIVQPLLLEQIYDLLIQQQKDGSWITAIGNKKKLIKITGLNHGVAGIAYFLLNYIQLYHTDLIVKQATTNALKWLIKQANKRQNQIFWYINNKSKFVSPWLEEGNAGIALCFLKAYEVFEDTDYLKIAENIIRSYPSKWITRDITQADGLTGIGEVYLEAARLSSNAEWQKRADWIAKYLLNHFKQQKNGSCYWLADTTPYTTAGLMGGNSGLIHFLLRYYQPGKISYIF